MTSNQQTGGDLLINLDELEESVASIPPTTEEEEPYELEDLYPEIHLPQDIVEEIMSSERLQPMQEKLDYLAAEMAAAQNELNKVIRMEMNERKEQMVQQQKAEDEEAVIEGMSNADTLRAMALVAELMHTMPGVVLEALDTLKNGGAPASVMQRISSSLIPSVEPYTFEPEPQAVMQEPVAQTEAKPFKSKKWSPNG